MRILGCLAFLVACSSSTPAPQRPAPAPEAIEEPARVETSQFNDAPTATTTQAGCDDPSGCVEGDAMAAPAPPPPCENPEGCVRQLP